MLTNSSERRTDVEAGGEESRMKGQDEGKEAQVVERNEQQDPES